MAKLKPFAHRNDQTLRPLNHKITAPAEKVFRKFPHAAGCKAYAQLSVWKLFRKHPACPALLRR